MLFRATAIPFALVPLAASYFASKYEWIFASAVVDECGSMAAVVGAIGHNIMIKIAHAPISGLQKGGAGTQTSPPVMKLMLVSAFSTLLWAILYTYRCFVLLPY